MPLHHMPSTDQSLVRKWCIEVVFGNFFPLLRRLLLLLVVVVVSYYGSVVLGLFVDTVWNDSVEGACNVTRLQAGRPLPVRLSERRAIASNGSYSDGAGVVDLLALQSQLCVLLCVLLSLGRAVPHASGARKAVILSCPVIPTESDCMCFPCCVLNVSTVNTLTVF